MRISLKIDETETDIRRFDSMTFDAAHLKICTMGINPSWTDRSVARRDPGLQQTLWVTLHTAAVHFNLSGFTAGKHITYRSSE